MRAKHVRERIADLEQEVRRLERKLDDATWKLGLEKTDEVVTRLILQHLNVGVEFVPGVPRHLRLKLREVPDS